MSKSSTATAPKNPPPLSAKSAWARGPPQAATAPSPRSQSSAPATPTHQTHSRRPSTLGQGVPIKDGVSVPRSNVGAVKQGSAVTFGSIDDVSAPISSSPAAAPSIKSEGVRSFGTVPAAASAAGHVNGKASISSRTSVVPPAASLSSSAASTPPVAAAAAIAKPKIDIKNMFQNPSSAPSSTPSSDSSSHQGQSTHAPSSQLAHCYTPFVPSGQMRPPQNSGPNGGPPRSPQYSRQMPNGNGPRSQGGQNGGPSAGLSSPRLGPHPHNGQSSPMPPPPPQMQPQMHQHMGMPWPGYYQPYTPDPQHYMYPQWYPPPPMPMQSTHAQNQHQLPNQHISPHTGMPMSPRNPPSSLQDPGTPTLSHALPTPVHTSHPPPPALSHPSNSIGGLTSPPPTPSSAPIPRLNAASNAFVEKVDGTELNIEDLSKSNPTPVSTSTVKSPPHASPYRHGSPLTPNRRPASIRIESEDQCKLRLAVEEQKEKEKVRVKAEAEEKARKEKEEVERKIKEAEDKKRHAGMPCPGYCEEFRTQDDFRTLGTRKKDKIKKNNDIQLVSDFLHRAVSSGMCSTVLLGQSENQTIADIVQGFAADSPNAFASLALMVKGAGLSDGRD